MAERFRITDEHGNDIYLEDVRSYPGNEARVMLTVDGDAPVPDTAFLGVEQAIALRDALDAFINDRFDAFIKQAGEGGTPA